MWLKWFKKKKNTIFNKEEEMIKIRWKIAKEKQGNWRPSLDFNIIFENCGKLKLRKLRPYLSFQKEYSLPAPIYFGKEYKSWHRDGNYCRKIDRIVISINECIDYERIFNVRESLHSFVCSSNCLFCDAYLEWRPGKADYSDYESVFYQYANDLIKAWQNAVAEAIDSIKLEPREVVVAASNIADCK